VHPPPAGPVPFLRPMIPTQSTQRSR
jgi:hypothetical protein